MTASVGTVSVLVVLCIVFAVLYRVFFALAVNFDCRSRNLKSTSLFTLLTALFPIITGIVYACVRNNAEVNKKRCTYCGVVIDGAATQCPQCQSVNFENAVSQNAPQLAKKSVVLFVVAAVIFALSVGAGTEAGIMSNRITKDIKENYTDEEIENTVDDILEEFSKKQESTTASDSTAEKETTTSGTNETTTFDGDLTNLTYYDRNGKAYDAPDKVPFYDKDGNVYKMKQDENLKSWFVKDGSDKKLEYSKCFVDKDGYFIYDEKDELTQSADSFIAKDKDGNEYSPAALVLWTKDGRMISSIN